MSEVATTTRRRIPRKTLIIASVAVLLAVAGVAFALYLMTAKVTGTASTNTINYSWAQNVPPVGTGDASTCAATIPSGGFGNALNTNVASYPGDTCTITANLTTSGSEQAKLTGVALTGLPSGWTAELASGMCGKTIATSNTPVAFKITVGPSGSGTIGGGISLTPVSQVSGTPTCAVQTSP